MWILVPRSVLVARGIAGAGAALLAVLILVGILHGLFVALYAAIAATLLTMLLLIANVLLGWRAGFTFKSLFKVVFPAFVAMTIVTWVLDLLLKTDYAVPSMVVAIDRLACMPYCTSWALSNGGGRAVVESVPDFYRSAIAGHPGGWVRYMAQSMPGMLAFAWILASGERAAFVGSPKPAPPPASSRLGDVFVAQFAKEQTQYRSPLRLLLVSAAAAVIALAVVFPAYLQVMLAFRNMAR